VPLFPPYLPLCVRIPLATVIPSRPRRGDHRPEPQSTALIAQMDCTCRQHPPGLDLVPDGGRTAKIDHRRRSATAETELWWPRRRFKRR
jgi:hypothetical protein